jgi:prepilin-type N-terminal cleavage/methylation domain-containing protein
MRDFSPTPNAAQQGFSLVELSIVLVILGLLTGGILGGQALIKAAELRSVTTSYADYQTASMTFRDKYMAFPGDMANATQFWGRADNGTFSGQCATPATDEGTGTQTCNGDGSGALNSNEELFRFWQHLANAGLINGEYTGVRGSSSANHHVIGVNCPRAKMGSNAGWGIREATTGTGTGSLWQEYPQVEMYRLGGESTGLLTASVLTPEDAWNLDVKLDDGKPGLGAVMTRTWTTCTTATAGDQASTADYNLSEESISCMLFFTAR